MLLTMLMRIFSGFVTPTAIAIRFSRSVNAIPEEQISADRFSAQSIALGSNWGKIDDRLVAINTVFARNARCLVRFVI